MIKKSYIYVFIFITFFIQYVNSDYGNKVNNFAYIDSSFIQDFDSITPTADSNIVSNIVTTENNDKRQMRYALYSVESDEMLNLRSLSRIKPSEFKFDPYFYTYGGGYLYPLGMWFYTLSKLEFLQIGDLNWMVNNPDIVEEIYKYGRVFVLIAFLFSAILFYQTICTFNKPNIALLATLVYLTSPALIMFSIIMKPHAYALLWCNLALLILFKCWNSKAILFKDILLIGVSVGFAVGSVLTFGLFALFVFFGLLYIVRDNNLKISSLIAIPLISLFTYVILNPYLILNFDSFFLEYESQKKWFELDFNLIAFIDLLKNSVFLGLGLSYGILLIYTLIIFFQKSAKFWSRFNIIGVFITLLLISIIAASISKWHVNSRYFFYLAPILLLILINFKKKKINLFLIFLLALNLIQSFPLVLAYHDEDNERFSTRLNSAIWINKNIDKTDTICTNGNSISPYDSPPFDFMSYLVVNNPNECEILISVERRSEYVDTDLNRNLLARFRPRFSMEKFPFVYSHINPQISIYRLKNEK